MFPELKAQHEAWLQGNEKQQNVKDDNVSDLNLFAPKKNLQELLRQTWFAEVRTNEKYDSTWTDNFIDALMQSEYGEEIARQWYDNGKHGKCNYIRGYIVGLLKDVGILSGNYIKLAKIVRDSTGHPIARDYLGKGRNQPYSDWVKEYVKG